MNYDELINLDDEKLIELNITLGARKKIMQSIEKLRERCKRIIEMIKVTIFNLKSLFKIKMMLNLILKTIDDEKTPLNNEILQDIIIELTEIATSPLKPINAPMTSISSVNSTLTIEQETELVNSDKNDPEHLSALFVLVINKSL